MKIVCDMAMPRAFDILGYTPARLTEGKEWFISFYVPHPQTGEKMRIRIKCNRLKSKRDRRAWAAQITDELNRKLAAGWNPLIEQEAPRAYHLLTEAMEVFLKVKKKELRPDSIRSYSSYCKIFGHWIRNQLRLPDIHAGSFTRDMGVEFLRYIYIDRDTSERTHNNYLDFLHTLFLWLIEQGYSRANPMEGIRRKKQRTAKTWKGASADQRNALRQYLMAHNYPFFIIMLLAYYTLIRRKEITYIRAGHIDLDKQTIFVPDYAAKNSHARIATIPDAMMPYLARLDIGRTDPQLYLFGPGFLPSKKRLNPKQISDYWSKVRKELGLPADVKFHGLRDSSITQMLRDGIPPDHVRDQADHSSLEITNRYTIHARPEGSDIIKKKGGGF